MYPYVVTSRVPEGASAAIAQLLETVRAALPADFEAKTQHHCTVLFARTWKHAPELIADFHDTLPVSHAGIYGSAVVLHLDAPPDSPVLRLHQALVEQMGATKDYATYHPHITIGYSDSHIDADGIMRLTALFGGHTIAMAGLKAELYTKEGESQ